MCNLQEMNDVNTTMKMVAARQINMTKAMLEIELNLSCPIACRGQQEACCFGNFGEKFGSHMVCPISRCFIF